MNIKLVYVGMASLPGVPARDLTEADLSDCPHSAEQLVASGLYQWAVKPPKKEKQPKKEGD